MFTQCHIVYFPTESMFGADGTHILSIDSLYTWAKYLRSLHIEISNQRESKKKKPTEKMTHSQPQYKLNENKKISGWMYTFVPLDSCVFLFFLCVIALFLGIYELYTIHFHLQFQQNVELYRRKNNATFDAPLLLWCCCGTRKECMCVCVRTLWNDIRMRFWQSHIDFEEEQVQWMNKELTK